VTNKAGLLSALSSAVAGDVIYVNDNAKIDLTSEHDIIIPAGVTLASGRGNGTSQGALLYSHNLIFTNGEEVEYNLFKSGWKRSKITGLRIEGNDGEIRSKAGEYTLAWGIWSTDYDVE